MAKKKPRNVNIAINPGTSQQPLNDALINPLDVEGNTNPDINYEPGIGWVAPQPLKELLRKNRERRRK